MIRALNVLAKSPVVRARNLSSVSHLYSFTEEETILKETVKKFANDVILPKVAEMDAASEMKKPLIKSLFEAGVC